MAKPIDYPRASLKSALELAQAVDDLGGKCSVEMAADKMNKKGGGAFAAVVGAAGKFGLVTNKGQLAITPLFRNYKLAYNPAEAQQVLTQAFLGASLFKQVFERFEGKEVPLAHFERLLIREFDVPDAISSRVSKYFLEGAKQCGLLHGNVLTSLSSKGGDDVAAANEQAEEVEEVREEPALSRTGSDRERLAAPTIDESEFSVRITGPGMDSLIRINEEEDLLIVEAMLRKVKKKLIEVKPQAAATDEEWEDS